MNAVKLNDVMAYSCGKTIIFQQCHVAMTMDKEFE